MTATFLVLYCLLQSPLLVLGVSESSCSRKLHQKPTTFNFYIVLLLVFIIRRNQILVLIKDYLIYNLNLLA